MPQKLYILVRQDLSPAQQIVQACHAVQLFTLRYKSKAVNTKVLLLVKDEDELMLWSRKALQRSLNGGLFREPNLNNQATALCCATDTNIFSNLPML